ncbi:MAG: hypothetical protein OSJ56_09905 [Prevotella sp.]|nr:hypothetical protein [Prevotella sp.]
MARADYNTRQVPRDSGGSYTPPEEERPEGVEPRKFILKEKIGEMMKYGLPLANAFPRKDRKLADILRESMMELYRLATRLERKYYKKTTLEDMDIELAVLKEFVVLASDRDYCGTKHAPPLTLHQREVWSRLNTEIGKIIGGYKKAMEAKGR